MNTEIKIGDYIRGTTWECPDHFGMVTGPGVQENSFRVYILHSSIFYNLPDDMEFHKDQCTKITPQEYFKHVLSRD